MCNIRKRKRSPSTGTDLKEGVRRRKESPSIKSLDELFTKIRYNPSWEQELCKKEEENTPNPYDGEEFYVIGNDDLDR